MAGVLPLKRQCDFESFAPARASVNSPPAASRRNVVGKRWTVRADTKNGKLKIEQKYKQSEWT
jgi:hypothetical protein